MFRRYVGGPCGKRAPLAQTRDHLPVGRLRFGFFALAPDDAGALCQLLGDS